MSSYLKHSDVTVGDNMNKTELAADIRAYLATLFPDCTFKSSWSLMRRYRKDWLEICYSGSAPLVDVIKQALHMSKIRRLDDNYALTVKKVD